MLRTERDIVRAEGLRTARRACTGASCREGPVLVSRSRAAATRVDLAEGQKTGFYLDQRENRRGRGRLPPRPPRAGHVLLHRRIQPRRPPPGGAREVLGVDSSQKAVALARANAERNGLANVRFESGEASRRSQPLAAAGERFGGVVLDPPKFARSRARGRRRPAGLSPAEPPGRRAARAGRHPGHVQLLGPRQPRGLLRRCSLGVAQQTGRDIQVLEQRGAAPDHPVAVTCPETEYLKCFICRVA